MVAWCKLLNRSLVLVNTIVIFNKFATILTTSVDVCKKSNPLPIPPWAGPVWFHQIGHANGGSFTWVIHPESTMGDLPWLPDPQPWAPYNSFLLTVFIVNTIMLIPHICLFFYTSTFFGLKILHSKVRKFSTKIASRQNSVKFLTQCEITHSV